MGVNTSCAVREQSSDATSNNPIIKKKKTGRAESENKEKPLKPQTAD
jgi:hypothetical protein